MPDRAVSDDLLQEIALAAWLHRDTLRRTDAFKPWILRIAANKICDFYRVRARDLYVPFDSINEWLLADSRFTVTVEDRVQETLDTLGSIDRQILTLVHIQNVPQEECARRLGIPLGTVKSRLHTARYRFKNAYSHLQKSFQYSHPKGEIKMSKLPLVLPDYKITPNGEPPFECKWEELLGWFIVPKLGEKLSWALYDLPERKKSDEYKMEVTGRASVHGIEGVLITAFQDDLGKGSSREFIARLTDTHVQYLAESYTDCCVKHFLTFLDGDAFLGNWGYGEDNCGKDIYPQHKGYIIRNGSAITCQTEKSVLDVIGRYDVMIGGKSYDTICIMNIENNDNHNKGVVTEQYLDRSGRTVLWRRFNHNDWHIDHYKQKWSDTLPNNERLTVNEELYVHWYDCITEHIMQH